MAAVVFQAIEAATLEDDSLQVVRRKNGFAPEAEAVGGYRDVKYNLLFQSRGKAGVGLGHGRGQGQAGSHSRGTVAAGTGGAPGPSPRTAVVEVQVILMSYLDVKKRMHAIYRVHRGDFG